MSWFYLLLKFIHVMAACVTYQTPAYANELYERCSMIPADHDVTDLGQALDLARGDRFQLGVIYRRPVRGKAEAELVHGE